MDNVEFFGKIGEQSVWKIRLHNQNLSCEILTYGATVRSLIVPDRAGKPTDVVLGYDSLEEYIRGTSYFGAIIGPVANRIGGAAYPLGGKTWEMEKNDGENSLHSGSAGLDRKVWDIMEYSDEAVTLSCVHPDGLGGIPGDIKVAVTYTLLNKALQIEYWAVSDRDTLCSLTNHCYFNLDGHGAEPITDHKIMLVSHSFTPTDACSIPTGSIRACAGTPMDLTHLTRIGEHIDDDYDQVRDAGGYDHNWLIDPSDQGMCFRPAALVKGAKSGISMTVRTDRPCVQFYTGNYIENGTRGKDGAVYNRRQALCLETQGFPDAPNHVSFLPITLAAGRLWRSKTEYSFSN
jgi:aldose 1-epimerase